MNWIGNGRPKPSPKPKPQVQCAMCFVAGTLVHTEDGLKPIEEIRAGDRVLAKDEETGDVALKPVLEVFVNESRKVYDLAVTLSDGSTQVYGVTANHPIWVEGKGWARVGEMAPGDVLSSLEEGGSAVVASITEREGLHTTYNFEVGEYHSYYVGEEGVWVHNARKCGGDHPDFDKAREDAFNHAEMNDPSKVKFSKVDPETGTVVEFKGQNGAKVGYDGPHSSPGPHHDTQHISAQKPGKRTSGGNERKNFPYGGPRHPSRSDRKN